MTGQEAGEGLGASAFHLPTLKSFWDWLLLAEMLNSLHKEAKAGP